MYICKTFLTSGRCFHTHCMGSHFVIGQLPFNNESDWIISFQTLWMIRRYKYDSQTQFKFMQRSERPSTSQYPDYCQELTSVRCDSVPTVETSSEHTDIATYGSYNARCRLTSEKRFRCWPTFKSQPLTSSSQADQRSLVPRDVFSQACCRGVSG